MFWSIVFSGSAAGLKPAGLVDVDRHDVLPPGFDVTYSAAVCLCYRLFSQVAAVAADVRGHPAPSARTPSAPPSWRAK